MTTSLAASGGKLYRRGGNLFGYGLKTLPADAATLIREGRYLWLSRL